MTIGLVSYGVAAAAFGILFLLLITSWRGRLKGGLLVIAVFVSLLWAVMAGIHAYQDFQVGGTFLRILEVLRSVAWLMFLFQLLEPFETGSDDTARIVLKMRPVMFAVAAVVLLSDLFPYLLHEWLSAGASSDLRIFGHLALAVGGLALIEQLFRNTRPEQRWATKYLYLGIGTLFAYDFFLYADALLFKRIDSPVWFARGLVNALIVPFLAVAAARNPQWSVALFISRRMVLHSVSIFGAGLYLLIMAAVGYYIRIYGGTWGTAVQMAFLFGAVALLVVLMFSGQLRAYIKVFLNKHFFNYKYDYREEWLKFIGTLSDTTLDMSVRQRAVFAIAEIIDSPAGLLWTRTEHGGYQFTAALNMNSRELVVHIPGRTSLVEFLERTGWVIDLSDYRNQPEHYRNLDLPPWLLNIPRAWLVVPLMQVDRLEGFVILAKARARRSINWEDRDLLKTAGRQLASYIALVAATEALVDARQFEAFNRLSAYVVHDLKNIVAQLSLVASNADRHKHNPAFVDDAVATVKNATDKMNRMLTQLRKDHLPTGESRVFELWPALREVITPRAAHQPVPVLEGEHPGLHLRANRDRFIAVLQHLVQNAQEATPADGWVRVSLEQQEGEALIRIQDNGCGMDERFIQERLFRPFSTTKGNAGMGIGVYESREFILSLGGSIDVCSTLGEGTTFSLRLPCVGGMPVENRETNQAVR